MYKVLLIFLFVFILNSPLFAESADTVWVRSYNGPGNYGDGANAMVVDTIGNVYVTGASSGISTDFDFATIKYYPNGDTAWIKRYNGPGNSSDCANAIAIDALGNVYVTGGSGGSQTNLDFATIKYYPDGDTAWVRRWNNEGPFGNRQDGAMAMAADDSGNVYVTGVSYDSLTSDDYLTVKYYPNGDTAWVRRYNSPANYGDEANAIGVDDSGNVYVTGDSWGGESTGRNYLTIKYHPNGDTAWTRRYVGPGKLLDEPKALAIDEGGYVYITGKAAQLDHHPEDYAYATIKYDPGGDTVWVRIYNGPYPGGEDVANDLVIDESGNIYVTGYSKGLGFRTDYATVKYYPNGDTAWVRRYDGFSRDLYDKATAIATDNSGYVYVTGYSYAIGLMYDFATLKYSPDGDLVWVQRYNGSANQNDYPYAIGTDSYGNVYVAGRANNSGNYEDYTTVKYCQDNPPNPFSLVTPPDSSCLPYFVTFNWESTEDPDLLEEVKYDLWLSTSSSFHPDSTVVYNFTDNQYTDTLELGRYYWKVRAHIRCAEQLSNQTWTFLSAIRGDANADKKTTVSDVVYLINFLFKGGSAPVPEPSVGDANCDGKVTVSDVVYLINYLFKGGPPPC